MTTSAAETSAPNKIKWALCIKTQDHDNLVSSGELAKKPMSIFHLPVTLVDRAYCETDNSLRQLIPYIVVRDRMTRKIYIYARGKGGGEERLFGNCSIGLGGHVDTAPAAHIHLLDHLVDEAGRELTEELGIRLTSQIKGQIELKLSQGEYTSIALDYDVHQYHLCFGLVVDIDMDQVGEVELSEEEKASIVNGGFKSLSEIRQDLTGGKYVLEAWSDITFKDLELKESQLTL